MRGGFAIWIDSRPGVFYFRRWYVVPSRWLMWSRLSIEEQRRIRRSWPSSGKVYRAKAAVERARLVAATAGEVTAYKDRVYGVQWVAVCRTCDASADSFSHRVDGCRWLVAHRAERHGLVA